jgi:hypothetical protein
LNAFIEVEGTQKTDGSIDAAKVEVEANPGDDHTVQFRGSVESLPSGLLGDWRVSGRTVHLSADTRIKRGHSILAIGAQVEVKGALLQDGTVTASKTKVRRED